MPFSLVALWANAIRLSHPSVSAFGARAGDRACPLSRRRRFWCGPQHRMSALSRVDISVYLIRHLRTWPKCQSICRVGIRALRPGSPKTSVDADSGTSRSAITGISRLTGTAAWSEHAAPHQPRVSVGNRRRCRTLGCDRVRCWHQTGMDPTATDKSVFSRLATDLAKDPALRDVSMT